MLTPAQLSLIDKHLRSDNWLLNNDLIAELTDHYVDAISDKVAQKVPFELALQDVHRSFGGRKGLLKMEENYVEAQEQTNFHTYRKAVRQAFQWPSIGYTTLVWGFYYGLLQNIPFGSMSEKLADFSKGFGLGLAVVVVSMFVWAFVMIYKQVRAGTFPRQATSTPTFLVVQSTIWIVQLLMHLPLWAFAETQPFMCASAMLLLSVHMWASIRLLTFVYRKHQQIIA